MTQVFLLLIMLLLARDIQAMPRLLSEDAPYRKWASLLYTRESARVDSLHPELPLAMGTLAAGQSVTYTFTVTHPASRHTISLHSLTGNADLGVAPGGSETWEESRQGALITDRISLVPERAGNVRELSLRVQAETDCQFVLVVTETDFHLEVTAPSAGNAMKVKAEEQFGDAENLLANLTISNGVSAWYEARVLAPQERLARLAMPSVFMFGPKQTRFFPFAMFKRDDTVTIAVDRSTQSALIYSTCDIVARLIGGGAGLPSSLPDDLLKLVPKLQPFAEVGQLFANGNVAAGVAKLIAIVKTNAEALGALQQFLSRCGIRVATALLRGKIFSGYGAISAMLQGLAVVKSPLKETIMLRTLPNLASAK
jgi:hypothetical protein